MAEFRADDFKDSDEFKQFMDEAVKTATKPLEDTKDGLLKDIGKLKEATKQFDGVDLEALKQAAADLERINKEKHSKESDAEKALRLAKEQHEATMTSLKSDVEALKGANRKLLVDDTLRKALVGVSVDPVLLDAAMNLHKPNVSVLNEDGAQVAKVGDSTIEEFVKSWTTTDEGKRFVVAPTNTGGGAAGGGTQVPANEAAKFFDKKSSQYSLTEQIKLKKSDPALYDRLSK